MTSAVETFTQVRTSCKWKRDEMSESESSDQKDLNDPGMAGNPPATLVVRSMTFCNQLNPQKTAQKLMRTKF